MEEVYKRIINWYGRKAQTIKACEELSELMDVLCKGLNKKMDLEALTEEMADVQVMIEQLKIIYNIPEEKLARIRMYGNQKYPEGGEDNWKRVEPQRYRDAMFCHMLAYLDDPGSKDEESGLPHLWHLACNVAFLIELEWNKFL